MSPLHHLWIVLDAINGFEITKDIITMTSGEHKQWIAAHLNADVVELNVVRSSPTSDTHVVRAGATQAYFKACRGPAVHEPALLALMHQYDMTGVPRVLAVDAARAWVLMADAGPTIREMIRTDEDKSHSINMVRALCALQAGMIPFTNELEAIGVPARYLDQLPQLFDDLVADTDWLIGISDADLARARAFAPRLRELCDELIELDLPYTLHHDDFHSGNAAVTGGDYCIYDFGESVIGHPLVALLIALRDAKYILNYDQSMLDAMIDEVIGFWSHDADPDALRAALPAAFQIAALNRALTWKAYLMVADDATRAEDGDAVAYWLMTCVNNTPLEA